MKIAPNRVCQIEVVGEWQDPQNGLDYDFSAKVILNRDYEVEDVEFTSIDVYDGDHPLDYDTAYVLSNNKVIKEQLESVAGTKAIEKANSADFCREVERE